ncbi:glutathione peroxidase, partial [Phenoliferia sp. Uapishka_3]
MFSLRYLSIPLFVSLYYFFPTSTSPPTSPPMSAFFALKAATPKGVYDFKQLEGKVTLIFNSASKCGYTSQLTGLQALYKKYNDQGLEVLGFPCNQFGGQEPGSAEQIEQFCTRAHSVSFPLMEKSDVNGKNENPVWTFLKAAKPGPIKWNFEKLLISKTGEVHARYPSGTRPEQIAGDIEKLLAE